MLLSMPHSACVGISDDNSKEGTRLTWTEGVFAYVLRRTMNSDLWLMLPVNNVKVSGKQGEQMKQP